MKLPQIIDHTRRREERKQKDQNAAPTGLPKELKESTRDIEARTIYNGIEGKVGATGTHTNIGELALFQIKATDDIVLADGKVIEKGTVGGFVPRGYKLDGWVGAGAAVVDPDFDLKGREFRASRVFEGMHSVITTNGHEFPDAVVMPLPVHNSLIAAIRGSPGIKGAARTYQEKIVA